MSKKVHHLFLTKVIILLFVKTSFAIESRSYREAILSSLNKKFTPRTRQYIALNGNYYSDYNSRQQELGLRYFYQSAKHIHDINIENQVAYADVGSGKKKLHDIKTKEAYDARLSTKTRIFNSSYYVAFYNRAMKDYLAINTYDIRFDGSVGKFLLQDKVELDIGIGKRKLDKEPNQSEFISSIRLQHKINDKFSVNLRGYVFYNKNSLDNELRSSIAYRIDQRLSLELRHNFETRRYSSKSSKINQVNRSITFGLIYDF